MTDDEINDTLLLLEEAISLGRRDGMAGQHLSAMCDARDAIVWLRSGRRLQMADPSNQATADQLHCAACGCEVKAYSTCNREETDAVWCFDCFAEMPCGKGWHGEGCPTNVFEDGERDAES